MQTVPIRKIASTVIGGLILSCCGPTRVTQHPENGSTSDQNLAVPEFSVSVSLSEAARKRLQALHESVLVIAYFDGDALPGQGKYNAPMRDVFLGQDEKTIDGNNEAAFNTSKISRANWNRLSNKDYFVTINTVSARKATKDNLLDCDDSERRISTFAGRTTEISCRLVEEQFRLR